MSDEKRLKRALKTHNPLAINTIFEEIYNKYKGLVCFVIAKYIINEEDVYDLAQDVFLDFFNNANNVDSSIKYYLTTMAKNKSLNYLKKASKVSIIEEKEINLLEEETTKDNYLFEHVLMILRKNLTKLEYKLIILHFFDNQTFEEISKNLNINVSTIKTIYYKSIKKSRKFLKEEAIYDK